jgi:hypothetical protein
MEGFHRSPEFYQNILGKIQTYLLTVDPCVSLLASQIPVMFADVRVEYDIDSDKDAHFQLPIPKEFDALLHFLMPKMAVQPGNEDHGLFTYFYLVYDLNIGCQYGYQMVPDEALTPEPLTVTAPDIVAAPAVVAAPAPISLEPEPELPQTLAPEPRPHVTNAKAAALATLRNIEANFDTAPGSETASRLACMLQVYRSMSRSVLSRLGLLPTPPQPWPMMTPSPRNPVMPPLMSLPVNLPNALLCQFSAQAQPKQKKKPHRGPRKPKYLQSGIINNLKLISTIFFKKKNNHF